MFVRSIWKKPSKGKELFLIQMDKQLFHLEGMEVLSQQASDSARVIHPNEKITYITAIDSSVVHLASTRGRKVVLCKIWESSCHQVEEYDAISG